MKTASFSIAILNFFSRHGQYFHPTKDQPRTRPSSTFLYICYNFRQIFCTNVIQFFSVENMGHNQPQKCTKYHLVSLLNEKQGSTFANFLDLFYPLTLLTNSAVDGSNGRRHLQQQGHPQYTHIQHLQQGHAQIGKCDALEGQPWPGKLTESH